MKNVEFLPCGDTAFSVQFGFDINRETCLKVLRLKAAVEYASIPGIIETVPTYRSLLVHYDPLHARHQGLVQQIMDIVESPVEIQLRPKRWRLPVCYDSEFGWDLEEVGKTVDKTVEELIEVFSSADLFVYMVGFILGFLYLGDLPDYMKALSRRSDPRLRLDSGAVGTAQGMAVVHSISSPGGWNVVGRTPAPLFDIRNRPPALFSPGDQIVFSTICRKEFQNIEDRVTANEYVLDYEEVTL